MRIIRATAFGSAIPNAANTYEPLGFGAASAGTTVTAHASANTKGAYASIGTTVNNWAGFWVLISGAVNATNRFLVSLSTNGGSSDLCPNLFAQPGQGTSGGVVAYYIPIPVASGAGLHAACQSGTGSAVCSVSILGVLAGAASRPGFTTMTALNVDTANTRPSTVDVPLTDSWVQLVPSTAAAYGSIIMTAGGNGTTLGTSQNGSVALGVGAASSEVEVFRRWYYLPGANAPIRFDGAAAYDNSIPSGSRLSVKADAAVEGTDAIRVALYGFV